MENPQPEARTEHVLPTDSAPLASIIHFTGGTTTYLYMAPSEIVDELERARKEGFEFIWLQPRDKPPNSVAIAPANVAAVFRAAKPL